MFAVDSKGNLEPLTKIRDGAKSTVVCCNQDLTALPDLADSVTYLNCCFNSLVSLGRLPPRLAHLSCKENQLKSLVDLPDSIEYLECSMNSLQSLVIPRKATVVLCQYNRLKRLNVPPLVRRLNCGFNELKTITGGMSQLNGLDCGNNKIESLPDMPQVTVFMCASYSVHPMEHRAYLKHLPRISRSASYVKVSYDFFGRRVLIETPADYWRYYSATKVIYLALTGCFRIGPDLSALLVRDYLWITE